MAGSTPNHALQGLTPWVYLSWQTNKDWSPGTRLFIRENVTLVLFLTKTCLVCGHDDPTTGCEHFNPSSLMNDIPPLRGNGNGNIRTNSSPQYRRHFADRSTQTYQ